MPRRLKTFSERMRDDSLPAALSFTPDEAAASYESGACEGAIYDPEGEELLDEENVAAGMPLTIADAAGQYGWTDYGTSAEMILPFLELWNVSGKKDWFGPDCPQVVGDCVAHSAAHSFTASLAVAVKNGHGSWPDADEAAYKMGLFHPSPLYWTRRHSGDGWSCSTSLQRAKSEIGMVIAKRWPAPLDVDLTTYNKSIAHKYGSNPPSGAVMSQIGTHKVKATARVSSLEEVAASLANGYCLHTCGSEGWSKSRDEWGFSKRTTRWSHALAGIGLDRSQAAVRKYGEPLILVQNSWGRWNNGPRAIHGDATLGEIPHGSFWAKWSDFKHRDMYAINGGEIDGWPPQKLSEWNLRAIL